MAIELPRDFREFLCILHARKVSPSESAIVEYAGEPKDQIEGHKSHIIGGKLTRAMAYDDNA